MPLLLDKVRMLCQSVVMLNIHVKPRADLARFYMYIKNQSTFLDNSAKVQML
ncbi:MAG: hypothetical protein U9P71_01645 [Campylobacterota bacterium]|nr:hypothetical protein [Campylobacterota bacterium]